MNPKFFNLPRRLNYHLVTLEGVTNTFHTQLTSHCCMRPYLWLGDWILQKKQDKGKKKWSPEIIVLAKSTIAHWLHTNALTSYGGRFSSVLIFSQWDIIYDTQKYCFHVVIPSGPRYPFHHVLGHSFRIGCAVLLLLSGVLPEVVAAMEGWTSLCFYSIGVIFRDFTFFNFKSILHARLRTFIWRWIPLDQNRALHKASYNAYEGQIHPLPK